MARVKDKDLGFARIMRELAIWRATTVTIGFDNEEANDRAIFNEFGTVHITSRPFMRSAIDTNLEKIGKKQEELLRDVVNRTKTGKEAAEVYGAFLVELVRARLLTARAWAKPLKASTVAAKGHSTPLRDTDLMLDSITFTLS